MTRKIIILIIAIAIPLVGGFIVSSATGKAMMAFETMNKPPLSPPAWLFPIAWTILYIMMGIASFLIFNKVTYDPARVVGLTLYILQLGANFIWSFIFFNEAMYLAAFLVLLLLWVLVFCMMIQFRKVSMLAFVLIIPYIIWLTFAGYLNIGIAFLN